MKLFFSVGEPSGDHHAARLWRALRARAPQLQAIGFGGAQMAEAGVEIQFPLTSLAVMGIRQVLPLLQKFRQLVRDAEQTFDRERPDAVILVDFPGFNWWIARAAKQRGIPVIYYCPPQLWAWAAWRIHKVRKYVDHVLACLPFEAEWYQQRGINAECVGHPFFDDVAEQELDAPFQQQIKASAAQTVAVLPGSRRHEIEHNFPIQLDVLRLIQQKVPDIRFHVANYQSTQQNRCRELWQTLAPELPVEFHVGRTAELLATCDVCLMKSGSSSLEVLARGIPAVVHYHSDWLTFLIGKALVTCDFMSLPNIIAGRELMPEFLSVGKSRKHVPSMANLLTAWLLNPALARRHLEPLAEMRESLTQSGATERAAEAIVRKLGLDAPRLKLYRAA